MAIPGKHSFLLYHDQKELIKALSDEQAGKLFKIIFNYSETSLYPVISDPVLNMAFIGIKTAMDRAAEKYQSVVERNRKNGKNGGRPRKNPVEPKKPSGFKKTQLNPKNPVEPKKADSDSDSERERVINQ